MLRSPLPGVGGGVLYGVVLVLGSSVYESVWVCAWKVDYDGDVTRVDVLSGDGPVFDDDGFCVNWTGMGGAVFRCWEVDRDSDRDRRQFPSVYGA